MSVQQALEKEQGNWIALLTNEQKRTYQVETWVTKVKRKCQQLVQKEVDKTCTKPEKMK